MKIHICVIPIIYSRLTKNAGGAATIMQLGICASIQSLGGRVPCIFAYYYAAVVLTPGPPLPQQFTVAVSGQTAAHLTATPKGRILKAYASVSAAGYIMIIGTQVSQRAYSCLDFPV